MWVILFAACLESSHRTLAPDNRLKSMTICPQFSCSWTKADTYFNKAWTQKSVSAHIKPAGSWIHVGSRWSSSHSFFAFKLWSERSRFWCRSSVQKLNFCSKKTARLNHIRSRHTGLGFLCFCPGAFVFSHFFLCVAHMVDLLHVVCRSPQCYSSMNHLWANFAQHTSVRCVMLCVVFMSSGLSFLSGCKTNLPAGTKKKGTWAWSLSYKI